MSKWVLSAQFQFDMCFTIFLMRGFISVFLHSEQMRLQGLDGSCEKQESPGYPVSLQYYLGLGEQKLWRHCTILQLEVFNVSEIKDAVK